MRRMNLGLAAMAVVAAAGMVGQPVDLTLHPERRRHPKRDELPPIQPERRVPEHKHEREKARRLRQMAKAEAKRAASRTDDEHQRRMEG